MWSSKERQELTWANAARVVCATHYIIVADDQSYNYYAVNVVAPETLEGLKSTISRKEGCRIIKVREIPQPLDEKPVAGAVLYVNSGDDRTGGKATIDKVLIGISAGDRSGTYSSKKSAVASATTTSCRIRELSENSTKRSGHDRTTTECGV